MSGSTEYVADANRARIMRAIVDHGPLSRVEIAQVSGLSPATVTRNIAYLMTVGVLAEDTTRVRTEGRSRIPRHGERELWPHCHREPYVLWCHALPV
jgi:predicted transcriptional regulator